MHEKPIDARAYVLKLVRDGTISVAKAEQVRIELGLEKFEHDPADKYNPADEHYWSLAMALAWIMTRNIEIVRNVWDDYRQAKFYFQLREPFSNTDRFSGFELRHGTPVGLIELSEEEHLWIAKGVQQMTLWDAERSLLQSLVSHKVRAFASVNGGARGEINPNDWDLMRLADSRLGRSPNMRTPLHFRDGLPSGETILTEVRFLSSVVQDVWRKLTSRRLSRGSTEKAVCSWLVKLMRDSPSLPRSKSETRNLAIEQFGALSKRAFDRAWAKASTEVPEAIWSLPGRRKSPRTLKPPRF